MVEDSSVKLKERAAMRVVEELAREGFRMKGAYFTPDTTGTWSLHIVPDEAPGQHWQYLGMHVSHVVRQVTEEMPEAGWLHFRLISRDDPLVRAISTLVAENPQDARRVSGYDGIKYVEGALVLRHAA